MKNKGLKLTYSFSKIEGVRHSIEYEINDLVLVYHISENYRNKNKYVKYDSYLAKIIEIIPSSDGLHFEQYGVEFIKTGGRNYWYYPTFLEPYKL